MVRVSIGLGSELWLGLGLGNRVVTMLYGVMVMVRVNTTQILNPDP